MLPINVFLVRGKFLFQQMNGVKIVQVVNILTLAAAAAQWTYHTVTKSGVTNYSVVRADYIGFFSSPFSQGDALFFGCHGACFLWFSWSHQLCASARLVLFWQSQRCTQNFPHFSMQSQGCLTC